MNKNNIVKLIEEKNITNIRDLLKVLNYPDFNYQVFWLTLVGTDKRLWTDDWEYFIDCSYEDGDYHELNEFEKKYYEIEFSKYDFIHYDEVENKLYYFEFKDDEPSELEEEDLEDSFNDYMTYDEIMYEYGIKQ